VKNLKEVDRTSFLNFGTKIIQLSQIHTVLSPPIHFSCIISQSFTVQTQPKHVKQFASKGKDGEVEKTRNGGHVDSGKGKMSLSTFLNPEN